MKFLAHPEQQIDLIGILKKYPTTKLKKTIHEKNSPRIVKKKRDVETHCILSATLLCLSSH